MKQVQCCDIPVLHLKRASLHELFLIIDQKRNRSDESQMLGRPLLFAVGG